MELIHLGVKNVTFWFLSLLVLYFCLTLKLGNDKSEDLNPLNLSSLIKVEPKYLYRSESKLIALVVGQLKLDIDIENVTTDLSQYNLIVISDLEFQTNTNITLKWNIDDIEYHTPIILTQHSKTPVDFKTNDSKQINDLRIIISQDTTLGTEHSFQDEISFQSIYLDHTQNKNNFFTNLSKWTGFNPIRFSSINSHTGSSNPIYKSLIFRLSIWVLSVVFLYLVFQVHTIHLLSSFFIAWAITTSIHLNNRIQQNQQIRHSFTNQSSTLNLVDKSSAELAIKIRKTLTGLSIENIFTNKIILIGGKNFYNQRLLHHLNEYNIGLSLLTSDVINSNSPDSKTFIFFDVTKVYCNNLKLYSGLEESVEVIFSSDDFCIARDK